jgi:hypothetical protein
MHRLARLAAEAAYLKIAVASVQSIAEAGRGLSRSFETRHALVPVDHAKGSASFRASAAHSAECRIELP